MHNHPQVPDPVVLASPGPLTSGDVEAFESLDAFVTSHAFRQLRHRLSDDLAYVASGHGAVKGFTHVLLDVAGVPIPVSKILGRAAQLGVRDGDPYWWYAPSPADYTHERDFRRAPVPGIHRRRGSHWDSRHHWKGSFAERRSNEALADRRLRGGEQDEEDAGVPVRHRVRWITQVSQYGWEPCRSLYGVKNWKRFRRTQWK